MQDVAHQSISTWICNADKQQIDNFDDKQQIVDNEIEYTVVLATACVKIQSGVRIIENCRAMLDTGAQMNVITESCVERLKIPAVRCQQMINGVTGMQMLTSKVRVHIRPNFDSDFVLPVELFVIQKLFNFMPSVELPTMVPDGIQLADPGFRIPAEVHMLLGADVWAQIQGNIG